MTRRARLLGDAAKRVDQRRSRSRQRKVGASDIGACRRRAGYGHHGTPVSDPDNATGLPAILGTWVHKGALATMRAEWGSLIETRVENPTLRGHVDAIELPNDWRVRAGLEPVAGAPDVVEVDDLKTKRDARAIGFVRNRGPARKELFQVHLYGGMLRRGEVKPIQRQAGLAAVGPLPVERVRLRYFPRTGEEDAEYVHEQAFDTDIEAEALEWVAQVAASTSPEELPRDQDGPGLSVECDYCPFVTACWGAAGDRAPQSLLVVTDDDLAGALASYDQARLDAQDAERRKDLARAMLDGTEPAIYVAAGSEEGHRLKWSGGRLKTPQLVPDMDAITALYTAAGLSVPMVPDGEATTTARTISVTRWTTPEEECGKPVGDPVPWREDTTVDADWWLQDRPRGGWTLYRVREEDGTYSHVQNDHTAGQFAKRFPAYVDPRPPCILPKKHAASTPHAAADAIVELDLTDLVADDAEDVPA